MEYGYAAVKRLLDAELAQLDTLNEALRRRDQGKFRGAHLKCEQCQKPLPMAEMLLQAQRLDPVSDDFDVRAVASPSVPDLACACGKRIDLLLYFQRGISSMNEQRRDLFSRCRDKLVEELGLAAEQASTVVRFLYRDRILAALTGPPPADELLLELKGVQRSYELGATKVQALRGVDLEIYEGEFIALIGASGAGKSTLLNIVAGLDRPSAGVVRVQGVDLTRMAEAERAKWRNRQVGFVFQSFNLIPVLNVYENVELPLLARVDMGPKERAARVHAAIADVELTSLAAQRPDQLSGGQRQRTAIARALVGGPSLVIADEPTANLDSKTAKHIVDLMVEMNETRRVTFVLSTHDETLIKRLHRTIEIADGRIVRS